MNKIFFFLLLLTPKLSFGVPSPDQLVQISGLSSWIFGLIVFFFLNLYYWVTKSSKSKYISWFLLLTTIISIISMIAAYSFYSSNRKNNELQIAETEFRCDFNYHKVRYQTLPFHQEAWLKNIVKLSYSLTNYLDSINRSEKKILLDIRLPLWHDSGFLFLKEESKLFQNIYPAELISSLEEKITNINTKEIDLFLSSYRSTFLMYYSKEEIQYLLKLFKEFKSVHNFNITNFRSTQKPKLYNNHFYNLKKSKLTNINSLSKKINWPIAKDGFLLDEEHSYFNNIDNFIDSTEVKNFLNKDRNHIVLTYANFYRDSFTYRHMSSNFLKHSKIRKENIHFIDYSAPEIRKDILKVSKRIGTNNFIILGTNKFDTFHFGLNFAYIHGKRIQNYNSFKGHSLFLTNAATKLAYDKANQKNSLSFRLISFLNNTFASYKDKTSFIIILAFILSISLIPFQLLQINFKIKSKIIDKQRLNPSIFNKFIFPNQMNILFIILTKLLALYIVNNFSNDMVNTPLHLLMALVLSTIFFREYKNRIPLIMFCTVALYFLINFNSILLITIVEIFATLLFLFSNSKFENIFKRNYLLNKHDKTVSTRSKHQTLVALQSTGSKLFKVLDSVLVENINKTDYLKKLSKNKQYIVRSSANKEDSLKTSNAGAFLSICDVSYRDIQEAVENVFNSFHRQGQVFIQEYKNFDLSGVYISTNSDNLYTSHISFTKGNPDKILQGSDNSETAIQGRTSLKIHIENDQFKKVIKKIFKISRVLENFYNHPVEIEWGYRSREKTFYILQCREVLSSRRPFISNENTLLIENEISTTFADTPLLSKSIITFLYNNSNIIEIDNNIYTKKSIFNIIEFIKLNRLQKTKLKDFYQNPTDYLDRLIEKVKRKTLHKNIDGITSWLNELHIYKDKKFFYYLEILNLLDAIDSSKLNSLKVNFSSLFKKYNIPENYSFLEELMSLASHNREKFKQKWGHRTAIDFDITSTTYSEKLPDFQILESSTEKLIISKDNKDPYSSLLLIREEIKDLLLKEFNYFRVAFREISKDLNIEKNILNCDINDLQSTNFVNIAKLRKKSFHSTLKKSFQFYDLEVSSVKEEKSMYLGIKSKFKGITKTIDMIKEQDSQIILICDTLSPQYINLFPKLSGIITKYGSEVSHLTIMANEYNIPIVRTKFESEKIIGKKISIDTNGVIKVLIN